MYRSLARAPLLVPSVCRPLRSSSRWIPPPRASFYATRTAPTARPIRPLKAVSLGLAATTTCLMYLYTQQDTRVVQAEADMTPVATAFGASHPHTTLAELDDVDNPAMLHSKSTEELLLSLFVYKLCSYQWLVDASPQLIKLAETLHLEDLAYWFVKHTFFKQFCGGETPEECIMSMDKLSRAGIGCILDLSVEADLEHANGNISKEEVFRRQEEHADRIMTMNQHCLRTAAEGQRLSQMSAYAAIKVTALAPVALLLRVNQAISRVEQAFHEHQVDGYLDKNALCTIVGKLLPPPATQEQRQLRSSILASVDKLDFIEFTHLLNIGHAQRNIWWSSDLPEDKVLLTQKELAAYDRMQNRLDAICQLAYDLNACVMIDAEQSYFQEAVDQVTLNLQAKFNRRTQDKEHAPTVYNTYQMYTKAAQRKLQVDVERARRGNFAFAAKLVRGAYMVSERKRAKDFGYPSPIHDTLKDTHDAYNGGVTFLLTKLKEFQDATGQGLTATNAPIVFMVATHNRDSVMLTIQEMEKNGIMPRSGVVRFGQLFGMQDQISYTLGRNGYPIYKYLPYGMVDQVIPYLIRRAQENAGVLGSVAKERELMWREVKQRLTGKAAPVVTTAAETAASDVVDV